ncbi:MAG TPA: bifunctional DNA-binding transcriptional regulator/O6-methylguanine-DNA methyltransferase Ada [Longimicrobiales bacterium]|nr:bifunctional DNA-binding transcriptional regulator/O6-methylguanine-DNA methyltransferase Ada [Longimicrobiales bacterium]
MPVDAEEAWAAVLTRDPSYDGRFFFAVATTGVYCRPGCASRRPRRENVRFFATAAQAAAAGFRACKRCRPSEDRPSAAQTSIERARAYLEDHLDENVTLERLARVAYMSAYHLQRTFKRHLGLTPRQYVEARRAERLKARLRAGDTVSRATFEAGYGSASRVYEQVDAHLGMTPGAYREGGRGMKIRFATAVTPLGRILVAATQRGLCAVTLGDDAASLEAGLRREYPRASIEPAGEELRAWVEAIVSYVEGTARDLAIPLDVRATRFQWRVWRALQEIPYGSTRSYREVAEAIGQPTAARAVARACATNRVALVIPCHRVVRGDGDTRGYRWGEARKRHLLEMESASAEA